MQGTIPSFAVKAVLFDLDGVILDSEPLHARADRETFEAAGALMPPDAWRAYRGLPAQILFKRLVAAYGINDDPARLVERKTARYLALAAVELELVPGALSALRRLRQTALKIGLTTTSFRVLQQAAFARHALESYFDVIVTGDDVTNFKPHPEPYAITCRLLGLTPQECLAVEDSPSGIRSARAAGCRVVALTTTHTAEELTYENPDYITDALRALPELCSAAVP